MVRKDYQLQCIECFSIVSTIPYDTIQYVWFCNADAARLLRNGFHVFQFDWLDDHDRNRCVTNEMSKLNSLICCWLWPWVNGRFVFCFSIWEQHNDLWLPKLEFDRYSGHTKCDKPLVFKTKWKWKKIKRKAKKSVRVRVIISNWMEENQNWIVQQKCGSMDQLIGDKFTTD